VQFHRIIQEHVIVGISCALPYAAFNNTFRKSLFIKEVYRSPFFFAFFSLIDLLRQRQSKLELDEPVDFIFDKQVMEKSAIFEAWDAFSSHPDRIGSLLGSTPIFADDKEVLPLQAADMTAWVMRRRWIERASGAQKVALPWRSKSIPSSKNLLSFEWDEEGLERQLQLLNMKTLAAGSTAGLLDFGA
jgi:hypothetical protein